MMAKTLAQFSVTSAGDGYTLHLKSDDGETAEFAATYEQLDVISEAIDEQLDADEEDALEVAGDAPQ